METRNQRRLRKLEELCAAKGGVAAVAEKSGLKSAYLLQILNRVKLPPKKGGGSRSERSLGDSAAQAIETAYELGRGWFDTDGDEMTMSPMELRLLGYFRELDTVLQEIVLENVQEAVITQVKMTDHLKSTVRKPITQIRNRTSPPLKG